MYILQIADLHYGSETKASVPERDLIASVVKNIKKALPCGSSIMLCICGDLIDSKDPKKSITTTDITNRYNSAQEDIKYMVQQLNIDYTIEGGVVIGNHDISHLDDFWGCVQNIGLKKQNKDDYKTCYSVSLAEDNIHIVFVNSCPTDGASDSHEYGKIDFIKLEEHLRNLPEHDKKFIVLHHTIMSMDESDKSSIRNAAEMIGLIDKYNVEAIFHGHTHGKDTLLIGNNGCNVIGVGALFSRNYTDVNSQFNLIEVKNGIITNVKNYSYQQDNIVPDDHFIVKQFPLPQKNNFFAGKTFEKVYKDLGEYMEVYSPLYNVTLNIKNTFNAFKDNLMTYLKDKKMIQNEHEYDYFELAKMWENPDLPDALHFNHGMYFKVNDNPGISYVIDELIKKRTSSRAGLHIGNMDKLVESSKTDALFPSLINIQFGFDNNYKELHVTMNLRALEVKRFLLINICEILFLTEPIYDKFRFSDINITINAFRVQSDENFGCFLKAEIDKNVNETGKRLINNVVVNKNYKQICKWLKGKKECSETVIMQEGITYLKDCIESNNEYNIGEGLAIYDNSIIDKFGSLISIYAELKEYRLTNSVVDDKIKEYERKINQYIDELINIFESLSEGDKHDIS